MFVWGIGNFIKGNWIRGLILTFLQAVWVGAFIDISRNPTFIQDLIFVLEWRHWDLYIPGVTSIFPYFVLMGMGPWVGTVSVLATPSVATKERRWTKMIWAVIYPGSGQIANGNTIRGAVVYGIFLVGLSGYLLNRLGYPIMTNWIEFLSAIGLNPYLAFAGAFLKEGILGSFVFIYALSLIDTFVVHRLQLNHS